MLARKQFQAQPISEARPLAFLIDRVLAVRRASAGVVTEEDWIALGEHRFKIFGVTRAAALRVDAATSNEAV
jgi:hypothetical protein